MAIAATDDTDVNIAVYDDAERRAMLVNVVDVPPLCNFILPAIVRTGPLAIAISTAGASPALAKRIKREIAEQYGEPYARLAVLLNEVRGWAKGTLPTYQDRKEFFEGIVNGDPDPVELLREDARGRAVRELIAARRRAVAAHGGARAIGAERRRPAAASDDAGASTARTRRAGARAGRARAPLRRTRGAQRGLAVARRRADAGRVRPERRRQDDAAARARDAAAAARRRACACSAAALPDEAWAVRGRVGLLGHEPLLYRELTARENLRFHARLHGVGAERVEELLDAVALSGRADEPLKTLSRGMVQRVAVARAALHDPELLLLDEPYANLDPAASELVEPLIGAGVRDARA